MKHISLSLVFITASMTIFSQPYIVTTGGLGKYGYVEKEASATNFILNSGSYGNIYQLFARSYVNGNTNVLTYGTAVISCAGSNITQTTNPYTFPILNNGSIIYSSVHADYCGGGNSYGGNANQTGFNERSFRVIDVVGDNGGITGLVNPGTNNLVLSFKIDPGAVAGLSIKRLWIKNDGTTTESTDIPNGSFKLFYESVTGTETFDGNEPNETLYGNYGGNVTNNNEYGNDALNSGAGLSIPIAGLRCYIVIEVMNTSAYGKNLQVSVMADGISIIPNRDNDFSLLKMDKTPSTGATISVINNINSADYRTRQAGNFSGSNTWEYNTTGSTYASTSTPPTSNNSIIVQHKLNLDQDFTLGTGQNFTLASSLSATDTFSIAAGKIFTIAGNANFLFKNVLFKSNSTASAILGQVTGTLANATNVTVERYIPAKRAWRMLTAPLSNTGTVYANWQNGGANGVSSATGVELWNPAGGGGFVTGGGVPNIQYFDPSINNWVNLSSTNSNTSVGTGLLSSGASSAANNAFSLFITGPYGSGNIASGASATTLKATGTLQTGTQVFSSPTIAANNYFLIGNPYASPVDFGAVTKSNIYNTAWVWDPNIGSTGGYVTISYNSGTSSYDVTPSSGVTAQTKIIQSGQAFFVQASAAGSATVTVNEANKSADVVNNVFKARRQIAALDITLNRNDAGDTFTPVDGVLAQAGGVFFNEVNFNEDAEKLYNYDENLSLKRGDAYLSIERRRINQQGDTLFLNVAKFQKDRMYSFTFKPSGFPAKKVQAFLQDNYLKNETELRLTEAGTISFHVLSAEAASYAPDRFKIVFRPIEAGNLAITKGEDALSVYPNPVINKQFTISMPGAVAGKYNIAIMNSLGLSVQNEFITIASGKLNHQVQLSPSLISGLYTVVVTDGNGTQKRHSLIIK